jgi:hypothetical protein
MAKKFRAASSRGSLLNWIYTSLPGTVVAVTGGVLWKMGVELGSLTLALGLSYLLVVESLRLGGSKRSLIPLLPGLVVMVAASAVAVTTSLPWGGATGLAAAVLLAMGHSWRSLSVRNTAQTQLMPRMSLDETLTGELDHPTDGPSDLGFPREPRSALPPQSASNPRSPRGNRNGSHW